MSSRPRSDRDPRIRDSRLLMAKAQAQAQAQAQRGGWIWWLFRICPDQREPHDSCEVWPDDRVGGPGRWSADRHIPVKVEVRTGHARVDEAASLLRASVL